MIKISTFRPKNWIIDKLIKLVREGFQMVKDPRHNNITFELSNLLNLAFAMFHLKDCSLSSFKEQFSVRLKNRRNSHTNDTEIEKP